ncbi:carboxypeptidase-like regulatory domain-containing protein [Winogradskyella vidalii]|uniref:carboxypeptidase-like regulatory domain-containing protein n=1 Tax=Winogradskyella vidalii TaxID=2615024 RepID=UPI0015C7ED37|nr:carboxypeptidase-like regulatory domain-containing protein [Winogradskyella vidalii]
MRKILLITLILFTNLIYSQTKGTVLDSISQEPIPYVNIWVENENIGTTSNEIGQFEINESLKDKILIFSAIGFKSKKVNSNTIEKKILLSPEITELEEVLISNSSIDKEFKVGEFEESDVGLNMACWSRPWILARFFPYEKDYDETRFIKSIKVRTTSDIKNAKFNIRLYAKNENGEPGEFLYNKNIIGIAKKGKRLTEIDLSEYDIYFPEDGLFIAIEWLIIEENKYEFKVKWVDTKKKEKKISYEPAYGVIPSETGENSMIYISGKWRKIWKSKSPEKYKDKYGLLAMELTLTD